MSLIDLVIPILAFFAVVSIGSALAIAVAGRRRGLRPRLGSATGAAVSVEPEEPTIVRAASRLGNLFTLGRISDKLGEQLVVELLHYRDPLPRQSVDRLDSLAVDLPERR